MLRLILIIITCIAASSPTHADLLSISPEDFQQSNDIKIATIIHNTPSAISHTTFTRIHNHKIGNNGHALSHSASSARLPVASTTAQTTQTAHTQVVLHQTPSPTVAVQQVPLYTTHHYVHAMPTMAKPVPPEMSAATTTTTLAVIKDDTPIVQPLTHTPAHLTFAARPVVYQMLPEIKPVRKISFDEAIPSPRNKQNIQKL